MSEVDKYRAARDPVWNKIYDTLRQHRLSNMSFEEGDGYCLVDLMTVDGRSIEDGEMQMVDLADDILFALVPSPALEAKELIDRIAALEAALEWYANPEIYQPHPHGPAFEKRDLSYVARAALTPPTAQPTPEAGSSLLRYGDNGNDETFQHIP